MNENNDEKAFELEVGTSLINGKYKVVSKVGTGSHSSVHALSMFKGQKQVVRAIKVVPFRQSRKLAMSKNRKSRIK